MAREVKSGDGSPLEGKKDLLQVFESGARPRNAFCFGLEAEKLGVKRETGQAIAYEGKGGVEEILKLYAAETGWSPTLDHGRWIGLEHGRTALTLEPGGQLELSSSPLATLDELQAEFFGHVERLCRISEPLGVKWLHLGLQPMTPLTKMSWVPKSRYAVMRPYYEMRSVDALEMMARTASIQLNVDYESEEDARKKVHIGSVLGPVVGALMANSYVEEGKLNGYCSRRLRIWQGTDPDRCGTPQFFVDGSFSFERYADYALDVPMYFLARKGEYIDQNGQTFRSFWATKPDEITQTDWEVHLTTLFPDVRLKNHLEFRTADANSPELTMGLVAFWAGLLWNPDTVDETFQRLARYNYPEIVAAMGAAAERGLEGKIGTERLLSVARDVCEISVVGLSRSDRETGRSDLRFLDPIRKLLERGLSPAEEMRRKFLAGRAGAEDLWRCAC